MFMFSAQHVALLQSGSSGSMSKPKKKKSVMVGHKAASVAPESSGLEAIFRKMLSHLRP